MTGFLSPVSGSSQRSVPDAVPEAEKRILCPSGDQSVFTILPD